MCGALQLRRQTAPRSIFKIDTEAIQHLKGCTFRFDFHQQKHHHYHHRRENECHRYRLTDWISDRQTRTRKINDAWRAFHLCLTDFSLIFWVKIEKMEGGKKKGRYRHRNHWVSYTFWVRAYDMYVSALAYFHTKNRLGSALQMHFAFSIDLRP